MPIPAESTWFDDFLGEARVARLATVDEEGRPHVVPVCFVYREGCVYIALDEKPKRVRPERLRRVRNIRANPNVQVLVDRYDEDWSKLAFVQLRGRASLLAPGPEQALALTALRDKYVQYGAMSLAERPLIKVEVDQAVSWPAGT
jgi:PPOX class probable F420-dependent enzyme